MNAPAAAPGASNRLWQDALTAAALFAVDPAGLGGILVRAMAGPVRDRWVSLLHATLPEAAPWGRIHPNIDEGRLLGALDLAGTLSAGRPQLQRGLLAEAHGGVLLVSMAERLPAATVSALCEVADRGCYRLERDGFSQQIAVELGMVLLDESVPGEETCAPGLLDRAALHVDLSAVPYGAATNSPYSVADILAARQRLSDIAEDVDLAQAVCRAAAALGVASLRACTHALRAARAAAALFGADAVEPLHAQIAARLVLAPRGAPDTGPAPQEDAQHQPGSPQEDPGDAADDRCAGSEIDPDALTELMIQAARAVLPDDPFAAARRPRRLRATGSGGRAGPMQRQGQRGQPAGSRAAVPRAGDRLDLLATLRAAAPWQRLRARDAVGTGEAAAVPGSPGRASPGRASPGRLSIRSDDLRVRRFRQRAATVTVFVVDASGSAAMQRLGEAKGAIELLLADCYVRRDEVALIAFRGSAAELLLAPTRSLVRAKRDLARLAGGGATPLAHGIAAAARLCRDVLARGAVPFLVFLSDGRPNVSLQGEGDRSAARADALACARLVREMAVGALVVDTSPRGQAFARELADSMAAAYQRLPYADPARLNRQIQELARGEAGGH